MELQQTTNPKLGSNLLIKIERLRLAPRSVVRKIALLVTDGVVFTGTSGRIVDHPYKGVCSTSFLRMARHSEVCEGFPVK